MINTGIRASINSEIESQLESPRNETMLEFGALSIQTMIPADLVLVQAKLGYGSNYGIWETPEKWMPPGYARNPYLLKIDFRRLLTAAGALESRIEGAVLCLSRYAILLALIPSAKGRHAGGYLKPSSIADVLTKHCLKIVVTSAKRPLNGEEDHLYFAKFSRSDWLALPSNTAKIGVINELSRALIFHHRGIWSDAPRHFDKIRSNPVSNIGPDERPTKEEKSRKMQPLPDHYVAEVGWRALWIVKEVGPGLIEISHQLADKLASLQGSSNSHRTRQVANLLNSFFWRDSQGNTIKKVPFELSVRGVGMREDMIWPPRTGSQLLQLLKCLQMAHLWITLLSVGSRIGELLSMKPGAVVYSSDGIPFANGLTFKIVSQVGGMQRDWPLPDVAVTALAQQEKLTKIFSTLRYIHLDVGNETGGADALWLRRGSVSEFTSDVNNQLQDAVHSLGLSINPGGEKLSTHRLRKSVARLVALAIAGAPKILMDLFGHKSIEMTLSYILSDPDVQAEVKDVVEAQTIMLAQNAIENFESNGGPASATIFNIVSEENIKFGSDYGADNIRELAEMLTMNGRHWMLVRPGVICTKLPGSSGPCTKNVGRPEPSRCSWSCSHRLESAFLRDDIDRSIDEAVQMYELEIISGNEIQAEFWAGQVLTHIRRFDELYRKWKNNSTVEKLLDQQQSAEA